MKTPIPLIAAAALLLSAVPAAAQPATAEALLEDARRYAATTSRPRFESFVRRHGPSARLEALMWELTDDPDGLAALREIFGKEDPWFYRRAAAPRTGRGGRD